MEEMIGGSERFELLRLAGVNCCAVDTDSVIFCLPERWTRRRETNHAHSWKNLNIDFSQLDIQFFHLQQVSSQAQRFPYLKN